MGKVYNGTTVLELVKGSSDSTVIPVFYLFIPELRSLSLETFYSGNYAGILASALVSSDSYELFPRPSSSLQLDGNACRDTEHWIQYRA